MLRSKVLQRSASALCEIFPEKRLVHLIGIDLLGKYYPHANGSSVFTNRNVKYIKQHKENNSSLVSQRTFYTTTRLFSQKNTNNVLCDNSSKTVTLKLEDRELNIPYIWLRDHCQSEKYYNAATNQKNPDPQLLERDIIPDSVSLDDNGNSLSIKWKDDHESKYNISWLVDNFYPGKFSQKVQQQFWNRNSIQSNLPNVDFSEHMSSDEGLRKTLSNLIKHGFCLVNGAPVSIEGTQSVVERVTFVLETLFGGMWSFTADASRSDTAYSTLALGSHTDMTYMDLPAGIQVFHCLKHTGKGGETLLVDGFHAVRELKESNPEDFELLSQLVIPHEYKEPQGEFSSGYHLYSLGPVIRQHPSSGDILQLRFNPYDRAPLNTVPPQQQQRFYQAYSNLSDIIAKSEGQLWVKLQPGTVLLIDNWRVMHGRSAFDGERMMCGCYLPRDEWLSKARMLGLL